jgi:hypothetical protein
MSLLKTIGVKGTYIVQANENNKSHDIVYIESKDIKTVVSTVKNYFTDTKGIAEGICKLLNEKKVVLDLSI